MTNSELMDSMDSLEDTVLRVKRERDKFRTAILKYARCRHGQIDCSCVNDARAALWEPEERPDDNT